MARKDRGLPPRNEPEMDADAKAAVEKIDRVLATIEDDLPERAWDKATDFFEDVEEKLKSVRQTITTSGRVTERQLSAIDGWERGVGKWIDPNG